MICSCAACASRFTDRHGVAKRRPASAGAAYGQTKFCPPAQRHPTARGSGPPGAAGGPLASDILQCQLMPLRRTQF